MSPNPEVNLPAWAAVARIGVVSRQTLGEALRLQLTGLLAIVGAGLVLLGYWLRDFNFGVGELKLMADLGLGVTGLSGTLLAALATAHLYFRDIEGGLAACVLTRRVRRAEYMVGKLAGVAALLALFTAGLSVLLGTMLAVRGAQLGVDSIPLSIFLQACALVWLKVTLVAAMTLLVCSYAGSSLFASGAGLMLAVVSHLRPFTAADGWLAWLRVWPNLGLFDPESLLRGTEIAGPRLLGLVGYWALFMLLLGGLAAYVFRRREL